MYDRKQYMIGCTPTHTPHDDPHSTRMLPTEQHLQSFKFNIGMIHSNHSLLTIRKHEDIAALHLQIEPCAEYPSCQQLVVKVGQAFLRRFRGARGCVMM